MFKHFCKIRQNSGGKVVGFGAMLKVQRKRLLEFSKLHNVKDCHIMEHCFICDENFACTQPNKLYDMKQNLNKI